MLTLFPREKEASTAKELLEIERTVTAQDEIDWILKEKDPASIPDIPNYRIYIYPRQF